MTGMSTVGRWLCMATARGESLVVCLVGDLDPVEVRNLERSTVALSIAKLWSEKRATDQLIASSTLLRRYSFSVDAAGHLYDLYD